MKELELKTQRGSIIKVHLEISNYRNNKGLFLGLSEAAGNREAYGDITVNLDHKAPDYCAYVDLNKLPELAEFIKENQLGEFTGLTKQSGFNEYPLYLFHSDTLRAVCPEGMAGYEQSIGAERITDIKVKSR
jgi:hypothetical protein